MKVQIDRDVLVWLHKQPRNVFLTVLSAILGLVSDPAPTELDRDARRIRAPIARR